jgi:hypothetical protein
LMTSIRWNEKKYGDTKMPSKANAMERDLHHTRQHMNREQVGDNLTSKVKD